MSPVPLPIQLPDAGDGVKTNIDPNIAPLNLSKSSAITKPLKDPNEFFKIAVNVLLCNIKMPEPSIFAGFQELASTYVIPFKG